MANPVSPLPSAQLPLITTELVDPQTGTATTLFHRFLTGLFLRTGGTAGASSTDALLLAQQALTVATVASTEAILAQTTATTAQTSATNAQSTANSATTAASSAQTTASYVQSTALTKANNLSDVSNKPASRQNLGVAIQPITVTFDTVPSGLVRYVPIVQSLTMPANFIGTKTYAGIVPTADAVFTIACVRSGVLSTIGTVTLIHSGNFNALSLQASVNLVSGDTLVIQCPAVADATLARLGISFPMSIT